MLERVDDMTRPQTQFRALRKLFITVALAIAMTAVLWLARRGVETYVVPAEKHSSWTALDRGPLQLEAQP